MEYNFTKNGNKNTVNLSIELSFADEVTNLEELRKNVMYALVDRAQGAGIAPEEDETFTTNVKVDIIT